MIVENISLGIVEGYFLRVGIPWDSAPSIPTIFGRLFEYFFPREESQLQVSSTQLNPGYLLVNIGDDKLPSYLEGV